MPVKVKAVARGYFGSLREPGEEFEIESEEQLGSWMKRANAPRGSKVTSPKKGDPKK